MAATSYLYPLEYIRPKRYTPICNVESILSDTSCGLQEKASESITRTSFLPWSTGGSRVFSRKEYQKPRMARGIMPQNKLNPSSEYSERLLPYHPRIKTVAIPTDGPFQFLPRRRKLPKPHPDQGVFYYNPPLQLKERSASAVESPACNRPMHPHPPRSACDYDRNQGSRDIMSVTGREHSRRKWLCGPQGSLAVGVKGVVHAVHGETILDAYLSPDAQTMKLLVGLPLETRLGTPTRGVSRLEKCFRFLAESQGLDPFRTTV